MPGKTIAALTIAALMASPTLAQDPHPIDFDEVEWQSASVSDMRFLQPYIGRFQSESFTAKGSGKEYFFTIRYEWYNEVKTVVKWSIDTHVPADGVIRPNGEGFYAFDPFENRVLVTGFFPGRPVTSKGWFSEFDTETGERVVRMVAMSPDGQVTQIRDTFRVIDEDTWANATFVSVNGGEWQAMPTATYKRVEAD